MNALATFTGVWTDSGRRMLAENVCTRAESAGLLGEDNATWSDFAPSLQEHVDDFLGPHCAGWGGQVAFVRDRHAFVEITPTEWGHEFGRAFFDHQYFDQKGAWTQSALNQFNHDHPNLYRPFLIEGLMRRDYDTSMGVSLATFRKVVERTVDESIRRGIVRARAPADYVPGTTNVIEFEQPSASDDERFQAIYDEAFCAIAKPSPKEAERNSVTCPSGSKG